MLGCAEMLALSSVLGAARAESLFRVALVIQILLNVVPLGLVSQTLRATLNPNATRLVMGFTLPAFLAVGLLLPLCLLFVGRGLASSLSVLLLLTLASFGIRSVLIWLPHRYNRRTASLP